MTARSHCRIRLACEALAPLLLLLLACYISPAAGQSIYTDYPVRFYVVGDWGRATASKPAGYNQTRVADRMARVAAARGASTPRFVISTGDNFYSFGLTGANDPNFRTKFINVYRQQSLQIPWHSVLGSHDYGHTSNCQPGQITTPLAQLDPAIRQVDSRFFAYRNGVLEFAGGKILIALWDTNPSQEDLNYGCFASFQGGLSKQDWVNNQVWLRDTLNRSTADWKLIVGHHPPHSSGRYAPGVLEVQLAVQRLIKRSGAQVYFAGHEHNLEWLHYKRSSAYQPNYHVVISGGGAQRSTAGFGSPPTNPTSRFSKWGRMTEGRPHLLHRVCPGEGDPPGAAGGVFPSGLPGWPVPRLHSLHPTGARRPHHKAQRRTWLRGSGMPACSVNSLLCYCVSDSDASVSSCMPRPFSVLCALLHAVRVSGLFTV